MISGLEAIRNRLGYMQYKAHSPDHLSNQKEVSTPLPSDLFIPKSTICLIEMILALRILMKKIKFIQENARRKK